jgi:hypothetical protein
MEVQQLANMKIKDIILETQHFFLSMVILGDRQNRYFGLSDIVPKD